MKTFVVVLAFASSSFAFGAAPNDVLGEADHHHSPYERLEHVFNHGVAAQLSDFTAYDGSAPLANTFKRSCTSWVLPQTTRDEVKTIERFPFLATVRIVVTPATPGTGPLFPAHPERAELRQAILLGLVGMTDTQDQLSQFIASGHVELSQTDDGLVQRQNGRNLAILRMHEGLVIVQQSILTEKGEVEKVSGYMYCWSN